MAISFRDRDVISITDFSREEILHLSARRGGACTSWRNPAAGTALPRTP